LARHRPTRQGIHRLVDLVQSPRASGELVHRKSSLSKEFDVARDVASRDGRTHVGADEPTFLGHQAECGQLEARGRVGQADPHRRPSPSRRGVCRGEGTRVTRSFEGVVHSPAGDLTNPLHGIRIAGDDGCGAHLLGERELERVGVDGDHLGAASQSGAHDRSKSDATEAHDECRRAGRHLGGVENSAHTGEERTAEERRLVEREVARDLDDGCGRGHGALGEGGDAEVLVDR